MLSMWPSAHGEPVFAGSCPSAHLSGAQGQQTGGRAASGMPCVTYNCLVLDLPDLETTIVVS